MSTTDRESKLLARVSKARANLKQARIRANRLPLVERATRGQMMVFNAQTELMHARNALSDYIRFCHQLAT